MCGLNGQHHCLAPPPSHTPSPNTKDGEIMRRKTITTNAIAVYAECKFRTAGEKNPHREL